MRYLGIDYGKKYIGLAISDEEGRIAFPYEVIENTKEAAEHITRTIQEEGVGTVVVGESRDNSGQDNPIQRDIERFSHLLSGNVSVPIISEPEFYTTVQARRLDDNTSKRSGKKSTPRRDDSAAALILQTHLDRTNTDTA